jgi:hypothetical protein
VNRGEGGDKLCLCTKLILDYRISEFFTSSGILKKIICETELVPSLRRKVGRAKDAVIEGRSSNGNNRVGVS